MKSDCISIKATNYFSEIVNDYVSGDSKLKPFYNNLPDLGGFKAQIESKQFNIDYRKNLCTALEDQYKRDEVKLNQLHSAQLQCLALSNTFTVTTGHQLCLFTGPLYFIYKIVSTIRLAEKLKEEYPNYNFVPIYWMATEDHDFEEISFFNLPQGRVKWKTNQQGAVGRMSIDKFEELYSQLESILPEYSTHASELKKLFKQSYKKPNHAAATRLLVTELFKDENLLIIDGDDSSLKRSMINFFEDELLNQNSYRLINETSTELNSDYKIQVNPRKINLFYLESSKRERIEQKSEEEYILSDSSKTWTKEELLQELHNFPERFSPNVILRPLYQEVILPNLAYIGGGGELAYWFQLRSMFQHFKVDFPILMLRNSAVFLNQKEVRIQEDCKLSNQDLFKDHNHLMNKRISETVDYDFKLNVKRDASKALYNQLIKEVNAIDITLIPHIEALQAQSDKRLSALSKKIERAFKRKEEDFGNKIQELKKNTFPNEGLQERTFNFSFLYLLYGKSIIKRLKTHFNPLSTDFVILKEE